MKQKGSSPVGLTFTGQPIGRIDTLIGFPPLNIVDNDLAETLVDAIKALAFTVAVARNRTISQLGGTEAKIAAREALIGFSLLAANEARALLILAAAGLSRHARVHFRSVLEYEFRVHLTDLVRTEFKVYALERMGPVIRRANAAKTTQRYALLRSG